MVLAAAWLVAAALLVTLVQWTQRRHDPAAEPGVRVAAVLLLEADARVSALPRAEAGQRAERAALVRAVWDEAQQQARLDRAPDAAGAAGASGAGGQVRFVVAEWQEVSATPRRARALLIGHYAYRDAGGTWRDEPDRTWRLRLSRLDPVGRTRGWRLVSLG